MVKTYDLGIFERTNIQLYQLFRHPKANTRMFWWWGRRGNIYATQVQAIEHHPLTPGIKESTLRFISGTFTWKWDFLGIQNFREWRSEPVWDTDNRHFFIQSEMARAWVWLWVMLYPQTCPIISHYISFFPVIFPEFPDINGNFRILKWRYCAR